MTERLIIRDIELKPVENKWLKAVYEAQRRYIVPWKRQVVRVHKATIYLCDIWELLDGESRETR